MFRANNFINKISLPCTANCYFPGGANSSIKQRQKQTTTIATSKNSAQNTANSFVVEELKYSISNR